MPASMTASGSSSRSMRSIVVGAIALQSTKGGGDVGLRSGARRRSAKNWHMDLIAEYLEAVTAGHIKRLLINMPPRYAKSTCVSIMWPTWVWTREAFLIGKSHN